MHYILLPMHLATTPEGHPLMAVPALPLPLARLEQPPALGEPAATHRRQHHPPAQAVRQLVGQRPCSLHALQGLEAGAAGTNTGVGVSARPTLVAVLEWYVLFLMKWVHSTVMWLSLGGMIQ